MNSFLKDHGACSKGAEFALKHKNLAEAWDACERPDWLLWAYKRKCPTPDARQLRLFACWCARQNWDKLTDVRSRRAVEVAEAFANGLATQQEMESARKDAYAAATDAATDAAYDAAYAAYDAATDAATDAAYDAAYAYADARSSTRKAQATQLKTMIPNPFL